MFFMGNTSFYNQLVVRDMVSSNSLNSLLSTIKNQGEEIESLQKELDKLKKKAAKK